MKPKIKWRVGAEPTGKYRGFEKRAWPSACYDNDQETFCAGIRCDDEYIPARVKTGNHAPLKVEVRDYSRKGEPTVVSSRTYATLKEAKAAVQSILKAYPHFMPKPQAAMNTLQITAYMHCALCSAELLAGVSAQQFRQLDVGWTEKGFQVWCTRHHVNVMHVDFQGAKHPADTTRIGEIAE